MPADFLARVAMRGAPLADPAAVVTHGERRVTVLTDRLLRLEWAPGGAFDDRPSYAFPSRHAPPAPFHLAVSGDTLTLDTGALRLTLEGRTGPMSAERLRLDFALGSSAATWRPGDRDPHNLRGARRTLDGCRGEAALDPGILSRSGWALHDDSAAVRFDPETGWVQPRMEGPRQDWYFFGYGHSYTEALADYARFGGQVPLPPRWALGAWWSRYWAYSDQDLRELVGAFEAHGFPLDVLVIDMDWHTPESWTGYTWNRELFPDPPALLAWLHERGLRATLNLHPALGVQTHEEVHGAFAAALGADPGEGVPFRIGDPAFARHYFELLHHPLEEQGVDFWWMDWQQGRESELPGLDPLPWLNHLHYRDMARRPGRRPMVFSRWGGLGNHRYPIGFSGDTFATWEALRFQPYFTATAANVLYGWWSHDIGGHFGVCEPELFARWVQFGALSPILRLHSTKDAAAERLPWAFPAEVRDAARAAFLARYELLPYLYTLARVHHERALAPCRPLYYGWPGEEAAYVAREQYLLGDQLLVAPIVRPAEGESGLAPADVWVPPGDWVERATGELLSGPAWARLVGDLRAMPQLVRAGGILPLAAPAERSEHQSADRLALEIFPGPAGELRVYEDDGVGEGYREGQGEWTPVALATSPDGRRAELTIGPVEGACEALPRERAYTVRFRFLREPRAVLVDGAGHGQWRYDAEARAIVVELPRRPKAGRAVVAVEADEPLSLLGEGANRALHWADARRLMGLPDAGEGDERAGEALLAVSLAGEGAAHRSALARLGGPFARVYEHTTPEDASRSLGTLVVAAPRDGSGVAVSGVWRLIGPEGVSEHPFELGELRADTIVRAPFAWGGDVATRRWALDLRLDWRGHELRERFTAQTMFPTIGAWRTCAVPATEALADDRLRELGEGAEAGLQWVAVRHTPAHGEFQNLTERFNVPLSAYAYERRDSDLVGYAVAGLRSADEREVRIAYQAPRPARVFLNGEELAQEAFAESDALRVNSEWSRAAPARLRRGLNTLLIVAEHVASDEPWRWFLHAIALGPDGLPAPEVVVEAPGSVLE
ncbi:MAG TPA: glycoside hydrolase family 31 protein [Chloroflexaceae bacterium]|nr:glycoside hydrolase family 31 protein [Chloroflexaceae bacterium]